MEAPNIATSTFLIITDASCCPTTRVATYREQVCEKWRFSVSLARAAKKQAGGLPPAGPPGKSRKGERLCAGLQGRAEETDCFLIMPERDFTR
jgi:hypothetical protein